MRKVIAELEAKSSSVEDVLEVIAQLQGMAPKDAVVYLEAGMEGQIDGALLIEETLTDGSKVYNIQL